MAEGGPIDPALGALVAAGAQVRCAATVWVTVRVGLSCRPRGFSVRTRLAGVLAPGGEPDGRAAPLVVDPSRASALQVWPHARSSVSSRRLIPGCVVRVVPACQLVPSDLVRLRACCASPPPSPRSC